MPGFALNNGCCLDTTDTSSLSKSSGNSMLGILELYSAIKITCQSSFRVLKLFLAKIFVKNNKRKLNCYKVKRRKTNSQQNRIE